MATSSSLTLISQKPKEKSSMGFSVEVSVCGACRKNLKRMIDPEFFNS